MRVLLLNLPRVGGYPVVREERYEHRDMGAVYPPLSLLHTATALARSGHTPFLLDANGFDLDLRNTAIRAMEFKPDLIISRLGFDTLAPDLAALRTLGHRLGKPIAVRNRIAADFSPVRAEILSTPGVSHFLMAPPELSAPLLADAISHGNAPPAEFHGSAPPEILATLEPDYRLLPGLDPYHTGSVPGRFAIMATSFGCPFKCSFCAYGGSKVIFREPGAVVDEMERLSRDFGVETILFFDDLVLLSPGRMEEICRGILKRGIKVKWIACTRANLVEPAIVGLMKQAGLVEMAVGIESGSEEVLSATGKGITIPDIRAAFATLKAEGVMAYGMVVLGLPGETRETVSQTLALVREIDPFYVQFCFATPFPNTPMFEWYESRGFILTRDWSRYWPLSDSPVVRTEALGPEDLVELRKKAYLGFTLRPSYLLSKIRLLDPLWTLRAGGRLAGRILRAATGRSYR